MLGRRIRYVRNQGRDGAPMGRDGVELPGSYEIVGIVGNLPARTVGGGMPDARVYHPLLAGCAIWRPHSIPRCA